MYFASHILECKNDLQNTSLVTWKSGCGPNNLSVHHMNTTQEEADRRMLLHAIDTAERGTASLCIQSPDMDVMVLVLWKYTSLSEETSVVAGTGAKRGSIPLGPLNNALGGHVVAASPGFHAFSGCDQTGTICGKSKISCWNALEKADEQVLEAMRTLACLGCFSCICACCTCRQSRLQP